MKGSYTPLTPFKIIRGEKNFLVREARSDSNELDNIAWGAAEAFLDDVMMNYFAGLIEIPTSVSTAAGFELYQFYCVVFKSCMLSRGRVIVVESLPEESEKNGVKNNIAAAAAWYGPKEDLRIIAVIRAGVLKVLRNYGLRCINRMGDLGKITQAAFRRSLKQRALTEDDVWYLQCIFTAKRFEGQGLMSALVREGFNYASKCSPSGSVPPIILESTSKKSRPRYLHLGFEIIEPWCNIGRGKVDSSGCSPANKKEKADAKKWEGINFTCMINWDCRKALEVENQ
ncbi:hypothetical protein J3R30DRAFT_3450115 [Lentinula aciculospora]|uniref:N-acetyltransferase domain-containing protein n=1 Tax=Lentinula aciculospora TaxID=153920 RepID=A0A9W9DRZ1_9AGAR|nr:hypothetical protein J3R30DRAFT_3527187 [Lentinula aciculospora]KAJ4483617.1 hypothetical protein J3R30DRAFT_3450115 [Lentinula aciculospora]